MRTHPPLEDMLNVLNVRDEERVGLELASYWCVWKKPGKMVQDGGSDKVGSGCVFFYIS